MAFALTPELPDIKDYHVSEDSVRTIGESVKYFAVRMGGPVAVMGLSFSGGLALFAATDPYHADFNFVLAVGSQDSMARVTQYYRTGSDERPDRMIEVLPHSRLTSASLTSILLTLCSIGWRPPERGQPNHFSRSSARQTYAIAAEVVIKNSVCLAQVARTPDNGSAT